METTEAIARILSILDFYKTLWVTRPPSRCLERIRELVHNFVNCSSQITEFEDTNVTSLYFVEGRMKWDDYKHVIQYSQKFSGKVTQEKVIEDRKAFIGYYLVLVNNIRKAERERPILEKLFKNREDLSNHLDEASDFLNKVSENLKEALNSHGQEYSPT